MLDILRNDAERSYRDYHWMLNEDDKGEAVDPSRGGLAARTRAHQPDAQHLYPVVLEDRSDNLMHFLRLRADPHAQYEIRVYAEKMIETLDAWVPLDGRGVPRLSPGFGRAFGNRFCRL